MKDKTFSRDNFFFIAGNEVGNGGILIAKETVDLLYARVCGLFRIIGDLYNRFHLFLYLPSGEFVHPREVRLAPPGNQVGPYSPNIDGGMLGNELMDDLLVKVVRGGNDRVVKARLVQPLSYLLA